MIEGRLGAKQMGDQKAADAAMRDDGDVTPRRRLPDPRTAATIRALGVAGPLPPAHAFRGPRKNASTTSQNSGGAM